MAGPEDTTAQAALPLGNGAGSSPASEAAVLAPAASVAPAAGAGTAEQVAAAAAPVADAGKVELVSDRASLLEKFDEAGAEKKEAGAEKPAEVDGKAAETGEKPAAEAKPAEAAAAGEKKPDGESAKPAVEAKPAEPQKLDPVAYEYTLPETITMNDGMRGEFHTALDGFRADPAKGAQGLIDLHNKEMTNYAQHLFSEQHRTFNATREDWNKQVLADEQIGGSGHQTAMKAIARMRDRYVSRHKPGTPEYQQDFKALSDFLRITGAGDHPVFLRILHNVSHDFDEPGMPPENPRPPADNGRAPGGRRAVIYDHPRSNTNRQ